jgi:small subunit ribosomal protein S9
MADEPTDQPQDQVEPTEEIVETPVVEEIVETPVVEEIVETPVVEEIIAEEASVETASKQEDKPEQETSGQPAEPVAEESTVEEPVAEEAVAEDEGEDEPEEEEPAPRVKPSVPGAHLEVDIVPEGVDPLAPEQPADPYAIEEDEEPKAEEEADAGKLAEPISTAAIDLAAGARYKATGKRKTAIARVILRPGSGTYVVNGRALDEHFPRITLQRNIRQPLETVGYQERMDVVARLHGGGISAQAGALRHGISRALLEADPNLRGELKRRGFLTRDSRAKERKKAGLKKARKRPQFSKR